MLSVHSTSLSQSIRRSLSANTQALTVSHERLASGKRINRAADDAAGMQISTRLMSSIRSTNKVLEAIDNGINYGKIAMGGLDETMNSLQRMRTLAIQAQNGINSGQDLAALNEEYSQLLNSIDDAAFRTTAFDKFPLVSDDELNTRGNVSSIGTVLQNGVQASNLRSGIEPMAFIPAGSTNVRISMFDHGANDDIQLFTSSGQHIVGTRIEPPEYTQEELDALDDGETLPPLPTRSTWQNNNVNDVSQLESQLFTAENGFTSDATYDDSALITEGSAEFNGMQITFSGDNNHLGDLNETVVIDELTEDLFLAVTGVGLFSVTAEWDRLGPETSNNQVEVGDVKVTTFSAAGSANEHLVFKKTPATAESLFISLTNIETAAAAQDAIERLDLAIAQVGEYQSYYGASINRLSAAAANNQVRMTELSNANSRIEDADYAAETAIATAAEITRDSANAILAQANSRPEIILTLLG